MKRSFLLIIVFILTLTACFPFPAAAQTEKGQIKQPAVDSPSCILINAKTGEVLWQKNPDVRRPMASTTKIMTAILAIENKSLDETVTVNSDVASLSDDGMKLTASEQIRLEDLLYALMLCSANDAAVAIADYIDGSVPKFIDRMNSKAKEIGTANTNFTSPNGLVSEASPNPMVHFSTARDLATLAKYAMKNKTFATIVGAKQKTLNREPNKPALAENLNKLLWTYPGADGVKTGYTKDAGDCLVASGQRDGISLISVVLGAASREALFNESASLLDYGFGLYENKRLIFKNTIYKTVKLKYGQNVRLIATANADAIIKRLENTKVKIEIKPKITAPVKKGSIQGKICIYQSGKLVATSPLVADKNIKKLSLIQIIIYFWRHYWGKA